MQEVSRLLVLQQLGHLATTLLRDAEELASHAADINGIRGVGRRGLIDGGNRISCGHRPRALAPRAGDEVRNPAVGQHVYCGVPALAQAVAKALQVLAAHAGLAEDAVESVLGALQHRQGDALRRMAARGVGEASQRLLAALHHTDRVGLAGLAAACDAHEAFALHRVRHDLPYVRLAGIHHARGTTHHGTAGIITEAFPCLGGAGAEVIGGALAEGL
mmetsp:Transcript_18951/g.42990  ORF Transcript_18951/g.42990 Transcript_18951/m.42990 type:complete len:218 (-) Transcript_18951:208-861(-)